MAKNRLTFVGNLTREPEVKTYDYQGKTVTYTSCMVALNHPKKKDTKALFVEVQFNDKFSAEIAQKLAKGQQVYVEGQFEWDHGTKGTFYKLTNASFSPGWLPPKKDDVPPAATVPAAEPETDDLDF